MSGEFDSRIDSQLTKSEQRAQIFVKLGFRELHNSKLSDLHAFDNMAIVDCVKIGQKWKGRLWVHETAILEVIFVTLTENSSAVSNDFKNIYTTRNSCRNKLPCENLTLKLPWYFYLLMEKPLGCYFGLHKTRQHDETRRHLFMYSQSGRSCRK